MSESFKLYRLQQVDSKLDQAQVRIDEIDAILSDDIAVQQAESAVENAESELQETRKSLRRAEEITRTQRSKIEQTENRLYGGKVQNPKELQELQDESAALKRYLQVLEDHQLEAMMVVDDAESNFENAKMKMDDARAKLIESHAALSGEKSRLMRDVNGLQSERRAAVEAIPEDDLRIYENLRRRRAGIGIAKVINKTCGACGTTLNSTLLQSARSPNQYTYCDTCGRILYGG